MWFPFLEFGRVRVLRSGEGNVSRTRSSLNARGLGDINKNTKIEKAVLEVRIYASAERGIAVRRGAGTKAHAKIPGVSNQQILEPNTLTEDQSDEH